MKLKFITVIAITAMLFGACTAGDEEAQRSGEAAREEQSAISESITALGDSQQIPTFDYSQERQTLIDVLTIRANGNLSTTAVYLEGVGMIWWCPSVGAPVPSTYQISATQQYVDLPGDETRSRFPIDQAEPTGVYVGDSAATWVLCLDDEGNIFGKYAEGLVDSTIGIVSGYPAELRATVDEITFTFNTEGGN